MPLKQFNTWLIVKTSVVWMTIVYIICAVAYFLLPTKTFDAFWKPMFHAFGMQPAGLYVIAGFIEAIAYTALAIWLWMVLYNYFARSKR